MRSILVGRQGKEKNHPARASLRDVMRKVWNDDSGDLCQGARVCICLMLLVNCCISSPELLTQRACIYCKPVA
jgi:hypothetical protein